MLDVIRSELERVAACEIRIRLDDEFEPQVGTLLRVELGSAYWHLLPEHFLDLLKDLEAQSGSETVRRAIEMHAVSVWHGPSPQGSRDA
ncbi:MAG: hypothetical protein WD845_15715 [Pirellulales bacterium]